MKIIKNGKVEVHTYEGCCRICGCEFELSEDELPVVDQWWGCWTGYVRLKATTNSVSCPTCSRPVWTHRK